MGGRRSTPGPGASRPREEGEPRRRGNARGHGIHHRPGAGAPRPLATGRSRSWDVARDKTWRRATDELQADLSHRQRLTNQHGRLDEPEQDAASPGGARLEGPLVKGVVVEVHKGACLVRLAQPPTALPGGAAVPPVLRVEPRGMLERYDMGLASLVAAGDDVEVLVAPLTGEGEFGGVLAGVGPRRNAFRRLHPSGRSIQTLAANLDLVAAVASTSAPDFRPGFWDRVLVCAASCSVPVVLVLNKLDLGLSPETAQLLEVYRSLGLQVLETSAETGQNLESFRTALAGRRTLLCGHSGVGKSSLLLTLDPALADQVRVGEVSHFTTKGRHTTTHARLYSFPGGELVDTPGLRELTPADTNRQNLWAWFPEIASRQGQCAYSNCTHRVEEGCAIRAAVGAGLIHSRRFESYVHILQTLPG